MRFLCYLAMFFVCVVLFVILDGVLAKTGWSTDQRGLFLAILLSPLFGLAEIISNRLKR